MPDLGGKEIVVVTENAYPPRQFVDPASGDAIGWEYDAMAEIAKRLNAKIVYGNISWDAIIPADRAEKVDFADPYMRSEMVMLVRGDETRFNDAASFAADPDLLMAAQPGTTPFYVGVYDVLDGNESNPRIKLFETFGAGVQALKTGDVDLVLLYVAFALAPAMVAARNWVFASVGFDPIRTRDFSLLWRAVIALTIGYSAFIASRCRATWSWVSHR